MSITELHSHRATAKQTADEVLALVSTRSVGTYGDQLLTDVLAHLLHSTFLKQRGFSETRISASMARAAAAQIGPQIDTWLELHAWMLSKGYTQGNEWSLGSCDRYACVMANEADFKSMILRTQSQTYLVAVTVSEGFDLDAQGQVTKVQKQGVDIRMCVNPSVQRPCNLGFMNSRHSARGSSYFACGDGGDRGYLISVRPDLLSSGWEAGRNAPDWLLLTYVMSELSSLVVSSQAEA